MVPTNVQLLEAMRIGLSRLANAGDELTRERIVSQLKLAVGELLGRSTRRREWLSLARDSAGALALQGAELLRLVKTPALTTVQSLKEANGDLASDERAYSEIKVILVDCVRSLSAADATHSGDAGWSRSVRAFFEQVARHEAQAAIDLSDQSTDTPLVNRKKFDAAKLAAYLARARDDRPAMRLLEAKSLSGGFSRETILVTAIDESGSKISLVIRKQMPGGLLGSSCLNLAGEIPYLELTHAAGLPVPQFFWYEPDSDVLGGDFVALSRMDGVSLGSSVAAAQIIDESIVRQLADMLAKLHTTDWSSKTAELCSTSGLPADVNVSAGEAAIAACLAFEHLWRESNLGPLPTLEIIADWLKRHVPVTDRRPMLSHGDVGFHNMMGEGGRLTAFLDWETARLADPAKDMAMTRNFITSYVPWEQFYSWYRNAGGPVIDDASLDYYAVYHSFAHLLVCEVALGARFAQSSTPDLEYLQLGLPVRAHFSKQMLASCSMIWDE